MAASIQKTLKDDKSVESKQLLYSDKFGQCYQEERLRIVGQSKTQCQDQPHTFSVPKSSVLSSLKSFLPRLSDSNMKMAQEIENDPERADHVNIECINDDTEGKHIEMNISLIPSVTQESLDKSDEDDDSSDNDENDSEEDEELVCENNNRGSDGANITPLSSCTKSNSPHEQINITKLKLPSSHKRGSKQKPHIEEMKSHSSTLQDQLTNR